MLKKNFQLLLNFSKNDTLRTVLSLTTPVFLSTSVYINMSYRINSIENSHKKYEEHTEKVIELFKNDIVTQLNRKENDLMLKLNKIIEDREYTDLKLKNHSNGEKIFNIGLCLSAIMINVIIIQIMK